MQCAARLAGKCNMAQGMKVMCNTSFLDRMKRKIIPSSTGPSSTIKQQRFPTIENVWPTQPTLISEMVKMAFGQS